MYVPPSVMLELYAWSPAHMNDYKAYVLAELGVLVEFKFRSKGDWDLYEMGTDVPMYMEVQGLPSSSLRRRVMQHYIGAYLVLSSMKVSSYSISRGMIKFRRGAVFKKVRWEPMGRFESRVILESYWGTSFGVWTQVKGHFWRTVLSCMR